MKTKNGKIIAVRDRAEGISILLLLLRCPLFVGRHTELPEMHLAHMALGFKAQAESRNA